ncbi:hypothetical protein NPIL_290541 [Nephila pilipes]|uniref:Uncharacterized protein n=1 Tax=Nephila pilipes TaxID=299642 RepID=A0A8X6UNM6_NEPPI|nr:hypothetical protein NPIL_290541 [Nephila pilipes]
MHPLLLCLDKADSSCYEQVLEASVPSSSNDGSGFNVTPAPNTAEKFKHKVLLARVRQFLPIYGETGRNKNAVWEVGIIDLQLFFLHLTDVLS